MSQPRSGYVDRMPEEIRAICAGLCRDVAALHLKWDTYLELFGSPANAALLSDTAQAFFQIIAESLRNDIVQSICRLGDPSRVLSPDNPSLATLVALCPDVPHIEEARSSTAILRPITCNTAMSPSNGDRRPRCQTLL
jgi:hypothetical protein